MVLSWAGLLVGVLYSPIGSPELYAPMQFSIVNGVDFANKEISNAPNFSVNISQSSSPTINIPANETTDKNSGKYSVYNSISTSEEGSSMMGGGMATTSRAGNGAGANSTGFWGSTFKRRSSKSTEVGQSNGVISMSTDLSMLDDNNYNNQTVGYAPGAGATDPGDEPIGNPIPVGDGLPFLLVLGVIYIIWKKARL